MKTIDLTGGGEGFCGFAYDPEKSATRAVIVVTGSDGGIENAKHIAEAFAAEGLLALAVGYFAVPGYQAALSRIPLEYLQRAISWLKRYDGGRITGIAAYGLSKGAEMVLLASTLFHDIGCVVAVAPNGFVGEGLRQGFPPYTGHSSWTLAGSDLPYAPMRLVVGAFLRRSLMEGQACITAFYEDAMARGIPDAAWIPVEQSRARILFLSAADDSMWPSKQAGERMVARLEAAGYPYAFRHDCFAQGSHLLSPMPESKAKKLGWHMRAERKSPQGCSAARERAFALATAWIKGSQPSASGYASAGPNK